MSTRIIRDTGHEEEITPHNGVSFTLAEVQAIVGGYVQMFGLLDGYVMLMDEEGKLKGKHCNTVASGLAHQLIVGTVLVCKEEQFK